MTTDEGLEDYHTHWASVYELQSLTAYSRIEFVGLCSGDLSERYFASFMTLYTVQNPNTGLEPGHYSVNFASKNF